MVGGAADGGEDSGGVAVLGDEAPGTGVAGFLDGLGIVVAAEEKHTDVGRFLGELPGDIERCAAGHCEIENDDVGAEAEAFRDELVRGSECADELHVLGLANDGGEERQDVGAVVGPDDFDDSIGVGWRVVH